MKWKCLICAFLLLMTGFSGVKAEEEQQYIVYLKPPVRLFATLGEPEGKQYTVMDASTLAEYEARGMVAYYEPDYEIKLFDDFNAGATTQWNLSAIHTQKAWDIGCYGNDVKVAVIDSGTYAHPDLSANLLAGHNYFDNNSDVSDNIGHGTYVSGIIAAECNDAYITGVSHKAKIIPLKCFDQNRATQTSMIADAIYDAVDVYHADVINMSFGMEAASTTRTLQLAVKYAQNHGCIVVAAVGNDGGETIYYPAQYDGVVGVGSVDSTLERSWFSQHNTTVDVVAPGGGVESVSIDGYANNSGTSFAAPHVSAMAAIAKCVDKSITPAEFQTLLEETSTDLGSEGYDTDYGYGLIDIEAMIDKMLENTPVFLSPVDVGSENVQLTVYNNGESLLQAVGIAAGYQNEMLKSMSNTAVSLLPKETVTLISNKENTVKFMLWDGMANLSPLSPAVEYSNQNGGNIE